MNKHTFGHTLGITAALLALGTTAFAQAPTDTPGPPGLPDTQTAPGPHSDTAHMYNDEDNNAESSNSNLPDAVATINGNSPTDRQYNHAIDEYKSGKLDDAAKDLQGFLKAQPGNTEANKLLAYTFLRQNKPADAAPYLETVVKAAPKDVQTRDNLGRVYLALHRPADATAQFQAVLAISPKDAVATRELATGPHSVTTTTTTTVITRVETDQKPSKQLSAKDYLKQGDNSFKANKYDDAVAAYDKSADLDPKNADLRLYIGDQCMKAGMTDKAIAEINQALDLHTKKVFEASTMLGELYGPTDPAKAISEFKLATDARPSDPAAWYNLGFLEGQAGNTADAKKDYQKVLDLNPADPALADHAKKNLDALGK